MQMSKIMNTNSKDCYSVLSLADRTSSSFTTINDKDCHNNKNTSVKVSSI